jgi:hypothetical protein
MKDLAFSSLATYLGKPKTNVDLKDKLRNLEKLGLVTQENGLYILIDSNSLE